MKLARLIIMISNLLVISSPTKYLIKTYSVMYIRCTHKKNTQLKVGRHFSFSCSLLDWPIGKNLRQACHGCISLQLPYPILISFSLLGCSRDAEENSPEVVCGAVSPLKVEGTSCGDISTTSGCSNDVWGPNDPKAELLSESTIRKVGRRVKAYRSPGYKLFK